MKYVTQHSTYGTIEYSESFWSGAKNLSIDGKPLTKLSKFNFVYNTEEENIPVTLKGNLMGGVSMSIKEEKVVIVPKPEWYVILLTILFAAFILVWGMFVETCNIIPILGGAMGSAFSEGMSGALIAGIGGALAFVSVFLAYMFTRYPLKPIYKILICLGGLVLGFFLCYIAGQIYLATVI